MSVQKCKNYEERRCSHLFSYHVYFFGFYHSCEKYLYIRNRFFQCSFKFEKNGLGKNWLGIDYYQFV